MFGYVKTDLPNMYVKDNTLYKAMYCGLCKGIGKSCGQKGRFLLSYDLTFLSVFLHNVLDIDVCVKNQTCIAHTIIKRPIALTDELTERIGALNVIMAYHKLNDDVIDSGKGRLKRGFFTSSYKKAKKKEPVLDQIVEKWYNQLLEYEKSNGNSIDIAADPFGQMLAEIVKHLSGDIFDDNLYQLSYSLGKWIYLIDALDDFDKDIKSKNFNVFINTFDECKCKEQFIKTHANEIVAIFSELLCTIENCNRQVKYKFNHDLIDNILNLGIKEQTKIVLENKKCKKKSTKS